jgi:hypothetical protein
VDATALRRLGFDGLADLLALRPDVTAEPIPRSLQELATRLDHPSSVLRALRQLDLPTLQVCEALAALGDRPSVKDLARLLDVRSRDEDLQRCLAVLRSYGLVTEDIGGPAPRLVADHGATVGTLQLAAAARLAWNPPLGLGPPLADLLPDRNTAELGKMLVALNIPRPRLKAEMIEQLLAALGDPERVRTIVEHGDDDIRDILLEAAETGEPVSRIDRQPGGRVLEWALVRGLLFPSVWQTELVMPSEIMLALRGGDFTAPFDPRAPEVEHRPVDPSLVTQDAAASASRFFRLFTAVLDQTGAKPVPALKSGRLTVRERRRLANQNGATAEEIDTVLGLALATDLLAVTDKTLSPTEAYDDWRAQEVADQLENLLLTWWTLTYPAAGTPDPDRDISPLRRAMLRIAAETEAAVEPEMAVLAAQWAAPLGWPDVPPADDGWLTWKEADFLGAVGAEAVSSIGLALLADDSAGLRKAFAGIGETEHTVRLQSDLTAVVSGTPSGQLRALLDLAADPEILGTASTWRFSPTTIRRALDSGYPLEELLGDLEAAAVGSLPQPLGYLIRDVGRTHGNIRAVEVVCCLCSEDSALLAEIVADRRLQELGLWALAPTVVASPRPLAETLESLRTAGFAPIAESSDGAPVVERVVQHRADPAGKRRSSSTTAARTAADPADLARLLLATSEEEAALLPPSETEQLLRPNARRLSDSEVRILAHAIDSERPVSIDYVTQNGGHSRRVIEQIELDGSVLHAYCQLRQDDRAFTLSRILSVDPVSD